MNAALTTPTSSAGRAIEGGNRASIVGENVSVEAGAATEDVVISAAYHHRTATGLLIRAAGTYQNVVDGGPAARFGAELRDLIENAIAPRAA
jgi:hypothetical protein